MKTTLRQLDQAIEAIAKAHIQVADYYWGDWTDSFEGRVQKYPAIVCNVQPSVPFAKQVTTVTLNLIAVDQVRKTEMLKEVESDMLQILHDFFKVMRNSPNWNEFCVVQSASGILKFKDASPDEVAGWQVQIVLKLIEQGALCDIPLDNYDYNRKIKC